MYNLALGHLSRDQISRYQVSGYRVSKYLTSRSVTICAGLLSLVLWSAAGPAQAHEDASHYRLAVVKMSMIMRNAPQAEAASVKLHTRFAEREEGLGEEQEAIQKAEEKYLTQRSELSAEESLKRESQLRIRQRELRRGREDLREEVRIAKDQALNELQKSVAEAIEAVRAREQIDIVFRESDYVVASQRVDITGAVLDYLRQQFNAAQQNEAAPATGATE